MLAVRVAEGPRLQRLCSLNRLLMLKIQTVLWMQNEVEVVQHEFVLMLQALSKKFQASI